MAETVLLDLPTESRKKLEQLIAELVHQRDVTRSMIDGGVCDVHDFRWLYHLRFNFNPKVANLLERLDSASVFLMLRFIKALSTWELGNASCQSR